MWIDIGVVLVCLDLQKKLHVKNKMTAILNVWVCSAGVLARLVATCFQPVHT